MIDNKFSKEQCMDCGVSQGSALGPILFLMMVMTCANLQICQTVIFVDDTNLGFKAKIAANLAELLN